MEEVSCRSMFLKRYDREYKHTGVIRRPITQHGTHTMRLGFVSPAAPVVDCGRGIKASRRLARIVDNRCRFASSKIGRTLPQSLRSVNNVRGSNASSTCTDCFSSQRYDLPFLRSRRLSQAVRRIGDTEHKLLWLSVSLNETRGAGTCRLKMWARKHSIKRKVISRRSIQT